MRSASNLASARGTKRIVGGWHHVVGVLDDNKEMRLYVDGELAGQAVAPGLLTKDPAQGLEIAADLGSAVGEYQSPFGFTGAIDEVRLYFIAATPEAIKKRFETDEEIGVDPRLVVTFDDESARDLSLYRNNGTLEGAVAIEGHTGKAARFSNNPARLPVANDDDDSGKATATKLLTNLETGRQ